WINCSFSHHGNAGSLASKRLCKGSRCQKRKFCESLELVPYPHHPDIVVRVSGKARQRSCSLSYRLHSSTQWAAGELRQFPLPRGEAGFEPISHGKSAAR